MPIRTAALLGRDDPVEDLGQGLGVVLDGGDQAGAGQPAAFEEINPEVLSDGRHESKSPCFCGTLISL